MISDIGELLLVIDMQNGFRYAGPVALLPNILKLKKLFKGKIVFSKFVNDKGSLFESQLNWTQFQDNEDKKLFPELQASTNIEFEHNGYTVITETLLKFIKDSKITKIYLCGIYTNVCVIKTAMDLFDENIETFVVEDACDSLPGENIQNSAIESLRHILGKNHIISTKDICL